ncbi:MAG TPA: hypothetical protein VE174_12440 [Actinomycetota bacterium]|nr:hypothetical protein [Actinomycetota bacterium]
MKRSIAALLLVVMCAAFALPEAVAKPRRQRVEKASYVAGGPPGLGVSWQAMQKGVGAVRFDAPHLPYVHIEIRDRMGRAVMGALVQDADGDGEYDSRLEFCTSTERPAPIYPDREVVVFLYQEPCGPPAGFGLSTEGTVVARFLRSGDA